MAVLAGDALLTLAFEWMANAKDVLPELKIKVIQEIASSAEWIDVHFRNGGFII